MPFIKKSRRRLYEPELSRIKTKMFRCMKDRGELTYLVYSLAVDRLHRTGRSYSCISGVISCLEDAAKEIRRRHLAPYEDEKIEENGDI